MMDLQQKKMVPGFAFKYWEIWVNWFVLWSVFFPELTLKNWNKINNIDSDIIEPVIFNTYKSDWKLCYTFSCEPWVESELWDYVDNITKYQDLWKFKKFINGLIWYDFII
jgi:hypothetical protein